MSEVKYGDPLTEEEKQIVSKRSEAAKKNKEILDKAKNMSGVALLNLLRDQLDNDYRCEHGRHYASPCSACDELDIKTIPPELLENDED